MLSSERLKGISVFVCAAESGSFTAAAARLNLTGSAVGKAVARIELRLGVRLFDRTTRKLALTPAGEAFYRTCNRVLGELEEAEQVLGNQSLIPFGRLRIDLPATYGKRKVMPLLLDFLRQHKGVDPVISFTDRFIDLHEEGIDIAVRIGGVSAAWPASLAHRYLGHEKRIFCCSRDYAEKKGIPSSLPELLDREAVLYRRADGRPAPWLIRHDASHVEEKNVQGRMIIGNAEAQVAAVLDGAGVAQCPTWLIESCLSSGELVGILPELATDGLPLFLVWQRSRQLLPKIDSMLLCLENGLRIG